MRGSMGWLRLHHCKSAKICQVLPVKKRFSGGVSHFRSMTYREPTSDNPPTITKVYAIGVATETRVPQVGPQRYDRAQRSRTSALLRRRLFESTDTLESAMAADARIGESSSPVHGYSAPAATGTPSMLYPNAQQ